MVGVLFGIAAAIGAVIAAAVITVRRRVVLRECELTICINSRTILTWSEDRQGGTVTITWVR